MISATFDTSVYIRAFNFGGPAADLIAYARAGNLRIDTSEAIIDETTGVLREKFQRDPYTINDVRQKLMALCNRVTPGEVLEVIKEDPDDNRILECAAAAKSDYIVSEDKDLLRVGEYRGAKIVTIRDFMTLVLAEGRSR